MGMICTNVSRQNSCICFGEKGKKKTFKEKSKYQDEENKKKKEKEEREKEKRRIERNKNKKLLSEEQIKNLNQFLDIEKFNEFQRDFYKNTEDKDNSFNILKKQEESQLQKEFGNIKKNIPKNIKDKFKFDFQFNDEKKLILDTIKNEETEKIYEKKIIDQIKEIKNNVSSYKIEYLTILLIGRKGIGKTTLIEYILNIQTKDKGENLKIDDSNENYTIYELKDFYLRLIEFKSFGLSETTENIKTKTIEYIHKLVKSEKTNYNNFVHSIWFCISRSRLERPESEIFQNLKNVYPNNEIPIIFVYLQAIDDKTANDMLNFIKMEYNEKSFIKVLAKEMRKKDPFGKEELLGKTMEECTKAFQGKMINLMTQNISQNVEKIMINNNEKDRIKINECIIKKFIEKYKIVKTDKDFIKYIIDIFKENLMIFYEKYRESISDDTLNILKKSNLINEVKKSITTYKDGLKNDIKSIIEDKAKIFICLQADIEKNNDNMDIEHKRRLKGFEKTNRKYFEQNYYFICQKYIIIEIIQKYMINYFREISNEIDEIIIDLLKNKNKNSKIKSHLEDCFKQKLENFADKANIPFEKDTPETPENPEYYDNEIHEIMDDEENYSPNNVPSKNKNEKNESLSNSIEKESSFLNDEELEIKDDMNKSLNDFFQNNIIQDTYFNIETQDDQVVNLLKKNIKFDLLNYIFLNKDFINNYKYKSMTFDKNPISKIIGSQQTLKIYKEKIKNEFKKIEINIDSFKIGYLSIIIIGRSGVGKSTLINSILKEYLAEEGTGDRTSTENCPYHNNKIPFLRLIDTVGIELNREYTPKKILENALKYLREQKSKENLDYNNYIHCIWYCVSGNSIEEKEIEIINNLKKEMSNLPLIVINTLKYEKEENSKIKQKIMEECNNIKFTQLLARSTPDKRCLSYGLDELIEITLKECNNASKGDSFNKMKEQITKTIVNNFLKQNKIIKESIKKEIIPKFLNYDKYLSSDDYKKYILNYLEKILLEFLKLNKEESNELSSENKDEINNFKNINVNIKQYNDFYKGESTIFINSILKDKTIEYLDFQVGIEKKEGKNIKRENKYNKDNFDEVIKGFLNNNFHFIAQKHYLDYINKDISESFIKYIGDEIIKKVEILLKNESEDLFKNIYKKKFEDFKNWINNYRKNNNIYNSLINTSVIQENINNGKGENNSSSRKISERSGKTSNKNSPTIKVLGIKASINSLKGNNYDKKNENNTSLNNISGKQEKQEKISKNNDSNIETPDIKVSLNTITGNNYVKNSVNTFNETKKPEERESENPSDSLMGPPPNI